MCEKEDSSLLLHFVQDKVQNDRLSSYEFRYSIMSSRNGFISQVLSPSTTGYGQAWRQGWDGALR